MTVFKTIRDDWVLIKNACRTTVSKQFTEKEPSEKFKKSLLIAEHSPIRLFEIFWEWTGIKYWVSTEWSRHKFEKFISSQRNDRQSNYDRNEARQDSQVTFNGYANMQNLIDAWRKRLCFQATKEARELAEDFKKELSKSHPNEANVLVPNCIYRCGCPELNECGFFKKFINTCLNAGYSINDLMTIQTRYDLFNEYFQTGVIKEK